MLQRREVAGLLGVASVAWALPGNAAATSPALFAIARSKNRNVVRYAVRLNHADLDQRRPVDAYWQMFAEDGRREELSWAERKLAYGFEVSALRLDRCTLRLTAFRERSILVERRGTEFRGFVMIAGQPACLERIFVQTDEGALLPRVQYLDLFGTGSNGERRTERITAS